MKRATIIAGALIMLLAACGGGDDTNQDSGATTSLSGAGGDDSAISNPQDEGTATVSVDGQEYSLSQSPALDCSVTDDAVTFAFWIGDNSVVLGGGANLYDSGWLGTIALRVSDPQGELGPTAYFPDLATSGDRILIEGATLSYSGPMMKQPPNDGSNPPPVDAGNGTITLSCG